MFWRRRKKHQQDLERELRDHLDLEAEELRESGVSAEEAAFGAHRAFGNTTLIKEEIRNMSGWTSLEQIAQDLRYSLRLLRKSLVFTTVAVFSLALGIGANTIIFSTVENVLLLSLPYPGSERLFAVWSRSAAHGAEPMHVSAADFYDWRAQSRAFKSLTAYASWPMNLTNIDEPRRLETELVSANLFSTLGVHALVGRTFAPDEDQEQSASVVVISHHLWREIGESAQIVGRQLIINGSPATVIGVMPADFAFPSRETDAWVPLSLSANNRANREGRWLTVIGRLGPNVSPREATTEMNVISEQLAAAYPATNTGWSASLVPLQEEIVGKARPILLTL
jgi:hypothetical protein